MGWDDLEIPDMENIPAGYLVTWPFINAFFEAFQERSDYIEQAERAVTYDDLILDAGQISTMELTDRLLDFNTKVRSCFDNTTWYKEETWTSLTSYTSGLCDSNKNIEGLGVITKTPWDETAIRILLADEVYDDIFTDYSYYVNFKPTYWSGLYKLIKYVMLYRNLTIRTTFTPTPTEPYLVVNGLETFGGSDESLSAVLAESKSDSNHFNQGGRALNTGSVQSRASVRVQSSTGDIFDDLIDNSVSYAGIELNPVCKTPALMNIETLLFRGLGEAVSVSSEVRVPFFVPRDLSRVTNLLEPVVASSTEEGDDYVFQPTVFVPDHETYVSSKAKNHKLPVSYVGDTCVVDISGLFDIRDTSTVVQASVTPVEEEGSSSFAEEHNGHSIEHYLNWALCELPQDEFEFKG